MPPDARPHVLYLTRNGLLEPLGQSQVLAYLRGLSDQFRITVISFEKPNDRASAADMKRMAAACAAYGIRWFPKPFRYRPRFIAAAWSLWLMFWLSMRLARRDGVALIHARSYLPAAVALLVNRLRGTPFIFDMRALWPEELIVAGRLTRDSVLHRALVWLERSCIRHAAGVVSLTHAAIVHLKQIYPREMQDQRLAVIPTCTDLDRFVPARARPAPRVYGCVGSVLSGWFRVEWLALFFSVAARKDPDTRFEIVTLDDADAVRRAVDPDAMLGERLLISSSPPERVHEAFQRQTASVMFFTEGLSKLGSSPTRMGEALASGIAVVANPGVGDTASIIADNRVGVLVSGAGGADMEAEMHRALAALEDLLDEADLAGRCRGTAEQIFSLHVGTAGYEELYRAIINTPARLRNA